MSLAAELLPQWWLCPIYETRSSPIIPLEVVCVVINISSQISRNQSHMLSPKGGAIPLFSSPLVMRGDLCLLSVSICDLPSGSLVAGGDMHYHLSQHGVFSEKEMRFYASEIILGLEHMHTCFVVYRDLKVRRAIPVVMATVMPTKVLGAGGSGCAQGPLGAPFSASGPCAYLPSPVSDMAKWLTLWPS